MIDAGDVASLVESEVLPEILGEVAGSWIEDVKGVELERIACCPDGRPIDFKGLRVFGLT